MAACSMGMLVPGRGLTDLAGPQGCGVGAMVSIWVSMGANLMVWKTYERCPVRAENPPGE